MSQWSVNCSVSSDDLNLDWFMALITQAADDMCLVWPDVFGRFIDCESKFARNCLDNFECQIFSWFRFTPDETIPRLLTPSSYRPERKFLFCIYALASFPFLSLFSLFSLHLNLEEKLVNDLSACEINWFCCVFGSNLCLKSVERPSRFLWVKMNVYSSDRREWSFNKASDGCDYTRII